MGLEDVYIRNLEHKAHRAGWLRAAVLGVNDGLVSTASLMVGVAAASASLDNAKSIIISTGAAGIAAGALSMAVGEYISVSSQTDIEESDRLLEIEHLAIDPEGELEELVAIYKERGLDEPLARAVATQLTEKDALVCLAEKGKPSGSMTERPPNMPSEPANLPIVTLLCEVGLK